MLIMNPEQRQAVEHGAGPLLVVAGPGAGKTRVITERILYLLESRPSPVGGEPLAPEDILGLTFTDKAAGEMKARVQAAWPGLQTLPTLCTFHAFCYQTLRKQSINRILLDKVDVWIFLRRRMAKLGLRFYQKLAEPGAFLHDLNEFFSRCQDELIGPEDFERYARSCEEHLLAAEARSRVAGAVGSGHAPLHHINHVRPSGGVAGPAGQGPNERAPLAANPEGDEVLKKLELAQVFTASRSLLGEAGASSLGSVIGETVALWRQHPEVLEQARARYRVLLVDEFQDTNYGQVELLKLLAGPARNITAVGDDDQAIYRFRGASHGAFEMFDQAFPGHRTVFLSRNYRSTRNILRVAMSVIGHNERYAQKPALSAEKPEGAPVYLLKSKDAQSEALWIADEAQRLVERGAAYGQIAVLYRAHSYRDDLVREFRRRAVPIAVRGLSLLSLSLLRDLVAYLQVIHSVHDNISLTRVLLAPRWRLPEAVRQAVRDAAARKRCSLHRILASPDPDLAEKLASTGWADLQKLLKRFQRMAQSESITDLTDKLTDELGWRYLPGSAHEAHLEAFRKFLEGWESKSQTRRLSEFVEYFAYFVEAGGKIEAPEPELPRDAVNLMTVHAAKGLEFPFVFLLSVAPRRFPATERRPVIEFPPELRKGPRPPHDIHLQEERRLFFVAVTRAQERLYVSSVSKNARQLSVFVSELVAAPGIVGRDITIIDVPDAPQEPPGNSLSDNSLAPLGERVARQRRVRGSFEAAPAANEDRPRPFGGEGGAQAPGEEVGLQGGQGVLFDLQAPADDGARSSAIAWVANVSSPAIADPLNLSATSAGDYLDCPLKFKFQHLLRIPTGPQPALTFGSLMHRSVRHYFELRRRGLPSLEEVRDFYLGNWKSIGFDDDYQEETYRQAGLDQLRAFVERHNALEIDSRQIAMEQSFQVVLDDIVLEGRIDQINPVGSSNGRGVELIDYKTGRPRSEKDAESSLQLSVYALAAREVFHLEPVRLTFYNLTNNEPVSSVRTANDLESAVGKIRDIAAKIREGKFAPSPGYVCRWCDFAAICPAHEE
jgi:DNA helicase II / ATP-dependent DNA helicase PcrA